MAKRIVRPPKAIRRWMRDVDRRLEELSDKKANRFITVRVMTEAESAASPWAARAKGVAVDRLPRSDAAPTFHTRQEMRDLEGLGLPKTEPCSAPARPTIAARLKRQTGNGDFLRGKPDSESRES